MNNNDLNIHDNGVKTEDIVNNLSTKVDSITDSAHKTVEKTANSARKAISKSADTLVSLKDKTAQRYNQYSEVVHDRVASKPMQSILLAAGVGAFIAYLLLGSSQKNKNDYY